MPTRQLPLLFILPVLCLGACRAPSENRQAAVSGPPEGLLLLHFFVWTDTAQASPGLRLIEQRRAPGRYKPSGAETGRQPARGDLLCRALDRSGRTVQELLLPDPLLQTFEYVGADGALGIKTLHLDTAHVLVRLPYSPQLRAVVVDQVLGPGIAPRRIFTAKIEQR